MDTVVALNEWIAKVVDGKMLKLGESTIIKVQIIRVSYNKKIVSKKNRISVRSNVISHISQCKLYKAESEAFSAQRYTG